MASICWRLSLCPRRFKTDSMHFAALRCLNPKRSITFVIMKMMVRLREKVLIARCLPPG